MVPGDPWIAYGLVFDMDLDGVADVRLGMDRVPAEWRSTAPVALSRCAQTSIIRAWKTDLRTGVTETGVAGDWICQCGYPGDPDARMKFYPGNYPTGDGPTGDGFDGPALIPGRFYVWASEIQDGRVVATDYAPDTGWLEVSAQ